MTRGSSFPDKLRQIIEDAIEPYYDATSTH